MSNYPIWWDTTLTVYNRYVDPQTQVIKWYRHVIPNCFWKYTGDKITINEVSIETNSTICRIPEQADFMEKYLWVALPNDQMGDVFTLGLKDIIIRGEVDDEIDEYVSGKRSNEVLDKYEPLRGAIEVQEVINNTGIGRNNPHYYVKGGRGNSRYLY